ncbi:hypothetical protein ADUPG1_001399, partial [Aduncisulcus paluster]
MFYFKIKKDGHMAVIEVEDNGPGMEEDVRKRVFEPFYSTKRVGAGDLAMPHSILVLDDDIHVRESLAISLEDEEFEV